MSEVAKLGIESQPIMQNAGGALPELFVINLCASMTPMPTVPKNLKGFEKYKLYQVSRQEDGRRRYRLRLGFFTSETDAEWVLNSVRSLYPAAFTGCVTQEDLRHADLPPPVRVAANTPNALLNAPTGAAPTIARISPPTNKPVVTTAATEMAAKAPAQQAMSKPTAAAKPIAAAKPALNLELTKPAVTQQPPAAPTNTQPFHIGRGIELPETNLELTDEYALPPALSAKASSPAVAKPAIPQPSLQQVTPKPSSAGATTPARPVTPPANKPMLSASIINPPKVVDDYVPILDTTLTIRTLTKSEAEDPNRPKWFAVQLALSEQPINLETMPKLDIFAAYSLYSVALMEGNGIKHALRLGFFRENVSAEAVMGYLKAFFNNPSINQISTAEYERFAEPKIAPKPDAVAEGKVVRLNEKRPAPSVNTATTNPHPGNPALNSKPAPAVRPTKAKEGKARMVPPPRPQSFLSRLIGRQLD